MPKRSVPGPRGKFLSEIARIKRDFRDCFNRGNWGKMAELYWDDAVLMLTKSKRVIQGRGQIVGFWKDFKKKKAGCRLIAIEASPKKPRILPVHLIGIMGKGRYNAYDMGAYEFGAFRFNPDGTTVARDDSYRHRITCATAISEEIVAL